MPSPPANGWSRNAPDAGLEVTGRRAPVPPKGAVAGRGQRERSGWPSVPVRAGIAGEYCADYVAARGEREFAR